MCKVSEVRENPEHSRNCSTLVQLERRGLHLQRRWRSQAGNGHVGIPCSAVETLSRSWLRGPHGEGGCRSKPRGRETSWSRFQESRAERQGAPGDM